MRHHNNHRSPKFDPICESHAVHRLICIYDKWRNNPQHSGGLDIVTYLGMFWMCDINYGFGPKPCTEERLVCPNSLLQQFESLRQHTLTPSLRFSSYYYI
jgi:hypothetical protein